jgi:hypothetical protein
MKVFKGDEGQLRLRADPTTGSGKFVRIRFEEVDSRGLGPQHTCSTVSGA